ncbi:MAG: GNAT family N-acetyltransferase [Clostridia bacterium]|nr:GNAT family N-acetyltransferase [Clostridia bacterium]
MEITEYTQYDEREILGLYEAVGWTAYTRDPDALRQGFEHSLLTLAAREDGELTGIIRAVGDGATIVYIQDLLVDPRRQRMGIGTALLRALLDRFARVRQIVLMTDSTEGTLAFYRAVGFRELSDLGCSGLMRC